MSSILETRSRAFRRPIKPFRVAPRPNSPFAEGLVIDEPGLSSPIDQRTLPTIDGAGLTADEHRQVNGARNRAMGEYGRSCPDAEWAEIERVGRAAATDQLRIVLKARPGAPPLPAKPMPMGTVHTPKAARRRPYTTADVAWWVLNSPTRHDGYDVISLGARWDRMAQEALAESRLEVGLIA